MNHSIFEISCQYIIHFVYIIFLIAFFFVQCYDIFCETFKKHFVKHSVSPEGSFHIYEKINFHTHTNRCRHADGIAADYVQSALSAGVTQLGFSDHAPFPDYDFGMRMPYCELSEYIEDINALTVQYRTDIILWKGLEIEYLPEYRDYYEALLTRSGMDYLLMGEHFYKNASGKTTNYTDALSTDEFPVYAQNVADGMKTGLFLAVAHPDIYMADNFVWDDNCKKAADIIIDTAVTTGTVLEYNANGFRREKSFIQTEPDISIRTLLSGKWSKAAVPA